LMPTAMWEGTGRHAEDYSITRAKI
jgi:hypothetical protein